MFISCVVYVCTTVVTMQPIVLSFLTVQDGTCVFLVPGTVPSRYMLRYTYMNVTHVINFNKRADDKNGTMVAPRLVGAQTQQVNRVSGTSFVA